MRFRSLIYFFLIFSIILFATGCGGDGFSSKDDPAGDNGGADNGNENVPPGPWLCFTANTAGSTVTTVISYGTVTHTPSLEYSYDGETWMPFVLNTGDPETDTKITLAKAGDKVYLRAKDKNDSFSEPDDSGNISFSLTGSIAASGNVMSLVDKDCSATAIPCDYCFSYLFEDCSELTTAPELPATTLAEACYDCMFYGCTNLTSAPVLPATTLAYWCYTYMFSGCIGLTVAPDLPATTLAEGCYIRMFDGCSSLTTAPALPATTLEKECYWYMFCDCAELTIAPELPAEVLVKECYREMFKRCYKLNSITVHFTTWSPADATTAWVNGVKSTGDFYCPTLLDTSSPGASKNPSGWTVHKP